MKHSWIDSIKHAHFADALDDRAAMELFKTTVQMVELEVHSFCNRRCWFCSNTLVNRRANVRLMDPELYSSIMRQLAEINYSQMISFSRYNEPFSQPIVYRRIAEARQVLPHAVLHSNTNGDYLVPATLRTMAQSGLNSLNIQCYLGDKERYDHEKIIQRYVKTIHRLGLKASVVKDIPGEWFEGTCEHLGMKIRIYGRNFEINGNSRGDTVEIAKDYVRRSPCLSPFYHFYVDWNGAVVPCCNLRSEVPTHADAVLARLTADSSIFRVFVNQRAVEWRRHLASFDPKAGLCRSCRFVTSEYDPGLDATFQACKGGSREAACS